VLHWPLQGRPRRKRGCMVGPSSHEITRLLQAWGDATYGQVLSYQPPTQARLGVEFTF